MRGVLHSIACLGLFACSSTPSVPDGGLDGAADSPVDASPNGSPDYASGTRLRAEVYASADGAKQWHGWYDSQLKTECQAQAAEDGQLRCIPMGAGFDDGWFADSNCTQQLASATAGCGPAPTYVGQPPATGCNYTVYAIGTKLGALTTVWSNLQGGCQPTTVSGPVDYYLVGAKVDPTTFVKETLTREARGPQLEMQFWIGDDGSKQPNGLYDATLKGSCSTFDIASMPYSDRCIPTHVGYAEGDYSDSKCTAPAITIVPGQSCYYPSDDLATVAWIYEPVTCKGAMLTRFAQIGATQSGSLYRLNGTLCQVDSNGPAQWALAAADVSSTSFPLISYTQSGHGRIVPNWRTAASGDELFVDGFYDTQLGIACDQRMASDSKLRCVPRAEDVIAYYTDDKCTSALIPASASPSCAISPPSATVRVQKPTSACGSLYGFYQVGSKVATPSQLWSLNGSCQTAVVDATTDYYAATEVDPATLAELLDVTE